MQDKLEEMSAFFDARAEEYDVRHTGGIDAGEESKRILASFLPEGTRTLLDLGVGTGLELVEIFRRFPDISVTGIDGAPKMLDKLRERFPENNIRILCGDYLTAAFGSGCYDAVLTAMTLHHYTHAVKLALYKRIYAALTDTGIYLENDYMLSASEFSDPQREEERLFAEYEALKREQHLPDSAYYHFDTPCTVDNQIKLLLEAGFTRVEKVWGVKNNITLRAYKQGV